MALPTLAIRPTHQAALHAGRTIASIMSNEGVHQGCEFGSAAYSLSVQRYIENAVRNLDNVVAVGNIDDLYIVGSATDAIEAHQRFRRSAVDDGMRFKDPTALWPHERPPPDGLRDQLQEAGIALLTVTQAEEMAKLQPSGSVEHATAIKLLGSAAGHSRQFKSAYATARIEAAEP